MNIPSCNETSIWKSGRWKGPDRKWPKGVNKPRTCSHCGSIHPEDLLKLIESGWELEPTTKCYKYYFHPAGYAEEVYSLSHAITEGTLDSFVQKVPSVVPVVKLYMDHVSPEMQEEINHSLMAFAERDQEKEI